MMKDPGGGPGSSPSLQKDPGGGGLDPGEGGSGGW
jgi:hypothetical protein